MNGPIWIPCEGSRVPGHPTGVSGQWVICQMCGREMRTEYEPDLVPAHDRDDILARIHRGDFT